MRDLTSLTKRLLYKDVQFICFHIFFHQLPWNMLIFHSHPESYLYNRTLFDPWHEVTNCYHKECEFLSRLGVKIGTGVPVISYFDASPKTKSSVMKFFPVFFEL